MVVLLRKFASIFRMPQLSLQLFHVGCFVLMFNERRSATLFDQLRRCFIMERVKTMAPLETPVGVGRQAEEAKRLEAEAEGGRQLLYSIPHHCHYATCVLARI